MSDPQNAIQKQDFLSWLEGRLPFRLPRIPLAQTAQNFDKAVATLVLSGSENINARIRANTNRIDAKAQAERALIEYGAQQIALGDNDQAQRAYEYAVGDLLKRQLNREEILKIAAEDLKNNPPNSDADSAIEDDWLSFFAQFAERKTAKDVQQMWARILTSEIRHPGSVSLRTLQFMSTVSSTDANQIVKIFSFVVDGSFIPKAIVESSYVKYDELIFLQQINLISGLYGLGGHDLQLTWSHTAEPMIVNTFSYHGHQAVYEIAANEITSRVGALVLTDIGKELFSISDAIIPNMPFFEWFVLLSKPQGTRKVSITKLQGAWLEKVIFDEAK